VCDTQLLHTAWRPFVWAEPWQRKPAATLRMERGEPASPWPEGLVARQHVSRRLVARRLVARSHVARGRVATGLRPNAGLSRWMGCHSGLCVCHRWMAVTVDCVCAHRWMGCHGGLCVCHPIVDKMMAVIWRDRGRCLATPSVCTREDLKARTTHVGRHC